MADPSLLPEPLHQRPIREEISGSSALALLRAAALELDTLATVHRGDPLATGSAFIMIDTLLKDLRSVVANLKKWTAEAMTAKVLTIEGVGTLETAGEGTKNEWDDLATLRVVVATAVENGVRARDLPGAILECAHIDYWRKTALQAWGIDYTNLALVDVTRGDKSVRITNRAEH